MLLQIICNRRLIQIVSLAVDHDDYRKILHAHLTDCLGSKVIISDYLGLLDTFG